MRAVSLSSPVGTVALVLLLLLGATHGLSAQDATDRPVGSIGTFERDTEASASAPDFLTLEVYVQDGWALAIQTGGEPGRGAPAQAEVGEPLTLHSWQGDAVAARITDRGHFQPNDRCAINRVGWAYVVEVDDPDALAVPDRTGPRNRRFMATRPHFEGRPLRTADPASAEQLYPTFRKALLERAEELRERAAQSRFISESTIERFIELMVGPQAEQRFTSLQGGWVANAAFEGPVGSLNLISAYGADDPDERGQGTWFTYLFNDDATVEQTVIGAHFPQAIIFDPELGHELILTTTGVIRPVDGGWEFPRSDEPQRCT
jgi:hypothetical protein